MLSGQVTKVTMSISVYTPSVQFSSDLAAYTGQSTIHCYIVTGAFVSPTALQGVPGACVAYLLHAGSSLTSGVVGNAALVNGNGGFTINANYFTAVLADAAAALGSDVEISVSVVDDYGAPPAYSVVTSFPMLLLITPRTTLQPSNYNGSNGGTSSNSSNGVITVVIVLLFVVIFCAIGFVAYKKVSAAKKSAKIPPSSPVATSETEGSL